MPAGAVKQQIVSRSQEPVRRIAKQARQMADPIERLRYLHGLVMLAPRKRHWDVPWWAPATLALATLAAAVFLWRKF